MMIQAKVHSEVVDNALTIIVFGPEENRKIQCFQKEFIQKMNHLRKVLGLKWFMRILPKRFVVNKWLQKAKLKVICINLGLETRFNRNKLKYIRSTSF